MVRHDSWVNRATGHGTSRDARVYTEHELVPVVDLEGLTLWRSDDILGRVAEAKPFDAWRRGLRVRVPDDGKRLGDAMANVMAELGVAQKFRDAGAMERALGGAAILPVLDGDVGDLRAPMPDEPNIRRVTALHVIQPRELVPSSWYADLMDPRFRFPERYRFVPISVLGYPTKPTYVEIHASRLIIFDGVRCVPHHVIGERIGWGDSVFLRVRQVASDFGIAWGSASTLLQKFAQATYAMDNLHATLAKADGMQQVRDRIALMDELASTIRAAVIDGKDKYSREPTPVSGMSDLLIQLAQRVAAAAEMPVTRLMGMSPAGLNATGESDTRTWYDSVEVYRRQYEPKVRQLLRLLWLSSDGPSEGIEPETYSLDWPPLWQPTEAEIAKTRLDVANADKLYAIDIGAVSPATIARSRWGGDSYSMDMHVDDDELDAMEEHEQALQDAQLEEAKNAAEAAKNPPPPAPVPGADETAAPPVPAKPAGPAANGVRQVNARASDG